MDRFSEIQVKALACPILAKPSLIGSPQLGLTVIGRTTKPRRD